MIDTKECVAGDKIRLMSDHSIVGTIVKKRILGVHSIKFYLDSDPSRIICIFGDDVDIYECVHE